MANVHCKSIALTLFFITLCFVGIPIKIDKPSDAEYQKSFIDYAKHFNKTYSVDTAEYTTRLDNFKKALETIKTWNSQRKSNHSALYGLTEFSDLSHEEFTNKYLKRKKTRSLSKKHKSHHHYRRNEASGRNLVKRALTPLNLPLKVDWRTKGVVTKVRNQGVCGACWAFSAVGVVESMLAIKTGQLLNLSVQEIIDCAKYGNMGCNGGDTCNLLEWIVDFGIKIQPESNYPLELKNGVCRLKPSPEGVQIAANFSCEYLVGEEEKILELIAFHGPVAVAVNANSWQYYINGVIQYNCPGDINLLNHAVQIVGYDMSAPIPYYIIRNSWGTKFGDSGYMKIAIGSNVCGIATEVAALDVV